MTAEIAKGPTGGDDRFRHGDLACPFSQRRGFDRIALTGGPSDVHKLVRVLGQRFEHYAEKIGASMTKSVLGIIGGSGIYELAGLEQVVEKRIE
ncbi:MAG: hypothetical protein ACXW3Q_13695, partial [Rhodoplanes sp.]